jgi:hypothetical protein
METTRSRTVREPRPASRPVIFIGLDGAEPTLLNEWMDSGDLPVLAQLRRDGICERAQTFPGFGEAQSGLLCLRA